MIFLTIATLLLIIVIGIIIYSYMTAAAAASNRSGCNECRRRHCRMCGQPSSQCGCPFRIRCKRCDGGGDKPAPQPCFGC